MKRGFNDIKFLFLVAAILFNQACKQPFVPPVSRDSKGILVADGQLVAGADSSIITLSRTRSLSDSTTYYPELRAQVSVQNISTGELFIFKELDSGRYAVPSLSLNVGNQYSMQIITSDGNKFLSDAISVVQTPPIDSISWNQDTTSSSNKRGVTVYASTHDPLNSTRYYRWTYEETWEYHAAWESFFLLLLPSYQVVPRNYDQFTYICYHDSVSKNLLLASSESLSEDVIYKTPLVFIPQGDEKLGVRYRINVKQYALSQETYQYWQLLKKNTELTGSIFDAQPSQQTGNLHCTTNPSVPIIGYIGASTVQQQSIFIKNIETEHWGYAIPGLCPVEDGNFNVPEFRAKGLRPIFQVFGSGYACTFPSCVDCTLRGGTTEKPSFW